MFGPASVCRFFARSALTPLFRDHFSTTFIKNATVINDQLFGVGNPIQITTPAEGMISFFNSTQYVYNLGDHYEVREMTSFGQTLHKAAQEMGSVDDAIGWFTIVGLLVVIAAVVLFPAVKTTTTLLQWSATVTAAVVVLTTAIYSRRVAMAY